MPDEYIPRFKLNASLAKGLKVLRELNNVGRSNPGEIARRAGVDRTTTYRLLETLMVLGYIERSPSDGTFVLATKVRELSDGLTEYDVASRVVAEEMAALAPKVQWPSDLAVFDRGWMVIRESTHRISPFSIHRQMVGKQRPLADSALGRAALCAASAEDRESMLGIAQAEGALRQDIAMVRQHIADVLEDYDQRGYCWSVGGTDTRISAIAVPVATGTGIHAALNVLFFTSALSIDVAAQKFLAPLQDCVGRIERRLDLL